MTSGLMRARQSNDAANPGNGRSSVGGLGRAPQAGITLQQLAAATGLRAEYLRERLREDVQRGAVAERQGRYALTAPFAREYARALRGVKGGD